MNSTVEEIRMYVRPTDVARRYLGRAIKEHGDSLWYKSPFRNERTASFVVSDLRGFHDFGDGWHGDTINFVQRYFSLDFVQAIKLLRRDYGLSPENEYATDKVISLLNEERERAKRYREKAEMWYNETYGKLCEKYREWEELRVLLKHKPALEGYKIAMEKAMYYDYLCETFREEDKTKLYEEKESFGWEKYIT